MKKIILLVLISCLALVGCTEKDATLSVHIIDVGQGDSILIKAPDNKTLLIDGGDENSYPIIRSYLRKEKVKYLDMVIASHPDSDHIGSLDNIINKFNTKSVYMTDKSHDSQSYYNLIESCYNNNIEPSFLSAGDTLTLGNSINIDILSPSSNYTDNNLNSIVLSLNYKNKSFLFTGDAEKENELDIINSYNLSHIDFLKVAHHGSKSSSTEQFIKETSPDVAVISCGYKNTYNHPHPETLNTLNTYDVLTYRTDKQGHLVFYSDGESIYTNSKPENN